MSPTTIYKSSAPVGFITIVAAIACACTYLSACSQFNAEAVVNPITGAAKISIHATKQP